MNKRFIMLTVTLLLLMNLTAIAEEKQFIEYYHEHSLRHPQVYEPEPIRPDLLEFVSGKQASNSNDRIEYKDGMMIFKGPSEQELEELRRVRWK